MQITTGTMPETLTFAPEVWQTVKRAAEKTGAMYGVDKAAVSLTLTDDAHIHEVNRTYRGVDRATDVISFALQESDEPQVTGGIEDLGEILISVERARAQAEAYGHSFERELAFLTVHGMLHLLGYDHMEEDERLEMEAEQRAVMQALGISREAPEAVKITPPAKPLPPMPHAPKRGKSGFIAVIGRPNVGKSTLINHLIGQKVAIMSDKPQTTRNRILCVLTRDDAQIVFIDTPGIHKPKHKLGEHMVRAAEGALQEVDAIFFVVDATEKLGPGERFILERLAATKRPVILAVNKLDLIEKAQVLPILENYAKAYPFAAQVPISAQEGTNLDGLLAEGMKYLPEGPFYYPDDMITDQPERLIIAELVREKALQLTHDEVPHAILAEVEEMKTRKNGDIYVRVTLYVERESQKGILIGKNGSLLKTIGARARADIEALLGSKTFLDLWVKVKKDWRDRENVLRSFGFQD